eukprot:g362.t1
MAGEQVEIGDLDLRFHHVQFYVDELQPVASYKKLEESFSSLIGGLGNITDKDVVAAGRKRWESMLAYEETSPKDPASFTINGQDCVRQMIAGLGWRVTGAHDGDETSSVALTSADSGGVNFVVTSKCVQGEPAAKRTKRSEAGGESKKEDSPPLDHFSAAHVDRFYGAQAGRQGAAALAFETGPGGVRAVWASYKAKHPDLLVGGPEAGPHSYKSGDGEGEFLVVEAFAYYKGMGKSGTADRGTIIRFVERAGAFAETVLPGLEPVAAEFDKWAVPAYSDHWVSNVVDRNQFLKTLEEVLGFTPKVDFNAGVVAAGAAKIESTVTGNAPPAAAVVSIDKAKALKNQQQVYLPINNDLGRVGHVHLYLEEIGQGIQHMASRVGDLVTFISRVNALRKMTGEGLSFLNIPRSYYGRLDVKDLAAAGAADAKAAMDALVAGGVVDSVGIVKLEVADEEVRANLGDKVVGEAAVAACVKAVKLARYNNLYGLLGDNLGEDTYVRIVENKVLVDIQGQDILYQIFTGNIMQRNAGEESPFLEFIQRVCSEKPGPDGQPRPIKPGCGGFGIRNFLTLFLSIEVSKAMGDLEKALTKGQAGERAAEKARRKIAVFTDQLDDSNPILTKISDAMTEEGEALLIAGTAEDDATRAAAQATVERAREAKAEGQAALQKLSAACSEAMVKLNEEFKDVEA